MTLLTPHYLLAEAARRCRASVGVPVFIDAYLTGAQIGAATRLIELGKLQVSDSVSVHLSSIRAQISRDFAQGTIAARQAFDRLDSTEELNRTLDRWFADCADTRSQVNIGYWLMCVFLRGLDEHETVIMTRFLSGRTTPMVQPRSRKTVRRYPTGGISEKQALLLPAFLRHACEKFGWSSSFLVARRLAHTGGTHDKLSVLPGMKFSTATELCRWDEADPPVRYFSAGTDFCPRDALLYRFRGETGTVPDRGLMVSSVMSKQIAMPADVIVLDVLFGATAFLHSEQDAEHFVRWCETVATEFNISLVPYFRRSDDLLGRCVGNAVEVWEAVKLLEDASGPGAEGLASELQLSLTFMELFAKHMDAGAQEVINYCMDGLKSGDILRALFQLWKEHSVHPSFLEKVRVDSRTALLGDLIEMRVTAPHSGVVHGWDALAIADLVNNRLNVYAKTLAAEIVGVTRGGLELVVEKGSFVLDGDCLAVLYCERALHPDTTALVQNLFQIHRAA